MTETKPSLVLEKIRNLAGKAFNDNTIKEMWLSLIPIETRISITPSLNLSLDELSKQADITWELQNCNSSSSSKPVFSVNANPTQTQSTESMLIDAVNELTRQVAALSSRNSRERSSSPDRRREKSRSYSQRRRYGSPSPYRSRRLFAGKCWYHDRFGERARKCYDGCSEEKKLEN